MKKKLDLADLIVFEDDHYLVVNKPPFLSTLEDRKDSQNLLGMARVMYPDAAVCHRLDKETSGALLIAKNQEAYRAATIQFEERSVEKVYHAFVKGRFPDEVLQVDFPLRTSGSGRVKLDKRNGKEAITLFRPKEYIGQYTIVEAKPVTGRTHQIRVHLSYLEYPICGDEFYGGKKIYLSDIKRNYKPKMDQEERPIFNRVALHAHSIKLMGLANKQIEQACDYHADMNTLMRQLKKFK